MKIAIIDDPLSCSKCPFEYHRYCTYCDRWIDETEEEEKRFKEVADWCELVEVPEKKSLSDSDEVTMSDLFKSGWNSCVDAVWGSK